MRRGYNLFEVWKKVQAVEKQSRINDVKHLLSHVKTTDNLISLLNDKVHDCFDSRQLSWQEKAEITCQILDEGKDAFDTNTKSQAQEFRSISRGSDQSADNFFWQKCKELGFLNIKQAIPVFEAAGKKNSIETMQRQNSLEAELKHVKDGCVENEKMVERLKQNELVLVNKNAELMAQLEAVSGGESPGCLSSPNSDQYSSSASSQNKDALVAAKTNTIENEKLQAQITECQLALEKERASKQNMSRALTLLQEQNKKMKENLGKAKAHATALEAKSDANAENARFIQDISKGFQDMLARGLCDVLESQKTDFQEVSRLKNSLHSQALAATRAEATLATERKILKRKHDCLADSFEKQQTQSQNLLAENARLSAKVACLESTCADAAKTNDHLLRALTTS